jgi:hypothetical protein
LLKLLLVKVGCFLQLVKLRGRKLRLSVNLESAFMLAKVNNPPERQAKGPDTMASPLNIRRDISESQSVPPEFLRRGAG